MLCAAKATENCVLFFNAAEHPHAVPNIEASSFASTLKLLYNYDHKFGHGSQSLPKRRTKTLCHGSPGRAKGRTEISSRIYKKSPAAQQKVVNPYSKCHGSQPMANRRRVGTFGHRSQGPNLWSYLYSISNWDRSIIALNITELQDINRLANSGTNKIWKEKNTKAIQTQITEP